MTTRITLSAGDYRMDLLPRIGGAIGSFGWRHPRHNWIELMRPTPSGDAEPGVGDTASFPLVPFSNRIRDGKFTFRGRTVQFPPSPIGKHYLHGTAWLQPWRVMTHAPDKVTLTQSHEPGVWPWAFDTSQEFSLNQNGLTLRMSTVNRSLEPMPFGFGLHPYFPLTPKCQLKANVTGWWEGDEEVMPVKQTGVRPDIDPRQGLTVASVVCDNAFTGWDGKAAITWPEHQTRLTIGAPSLMDKLFFYVPPNATFFCFEPITHFADAFNMAAAGRTDTGMIVLEPGQEVSAEVTFRADATG